MIKQLTMALVLADRHNGTADHHETISEHTVDHGLGPTFLFCLWLIRKFMNCQGAIFATFSKSNLARFFTRLSREKAV